MPVHFYCQKRVFKRFDSSRRFRLLCRTKEKWIVPISAMIFRAYNLEKINYKNTIIL